MHMHNTHTEPTIDPSTSDPTKVPTQGMQMRLDLHPIRAMISNLASLRAFNGALDDSHLAADHDAHDVSGSRSES